MSTMMMAKPQMSLQKPTNVDTRMLLTKHKPEQHPSATRNKEALGL